MPEEHGAVKAATDEQFLVNGMSGNRLKRKEPLHQLSIQEGKIELTAYCRRLSCGLGMIELLLSAFADRTTCTDGPWMS